MQTNLAPRFHNQPRGREAEAILRACVHCGFCTATCPTYLDLRDERDGPRGRIYLIKQLLEGAEVGAATRRHLDRCLTCRSCETTCPSGVRYGRLIDIAREVMEEDLPRPLPGRVARAALRWVFRRRWRMAAAVTLGRLTGKIPPAPPASPWPSRRHPRVMLALAGCIQSSATPNVNAAAARVLDRLGISLAVAPQAGCCGAVAHHLGATGESHALMKRNIDSWWPAVEAGAEAILPTASGCASMLRDYGTLLADDPVYAPKAQRIAALVRDPSEVLLAEDLAPLRLMPDQGRVAVHVPCSQQHALKLPDSVETLLRRLGFQLAPCRDKHLCCGSAGTYSLLEPELSERLRARKLDALTAGRPDTIVTANIGCQMHLGKASAVPVRHWIEVLDGGES
jgi:glycolate oxidase iron-sulfur subunit